MTIGRSVAVMTVTLLTGWVVALSSGPADADVPVVGDVSACNEAARGAIRGSTAFPTPRDETQAEEARAGRTTAQRSDLQATVTRFVDPQIEGIDPEGATNATYRSAYRVCMRKKGF